MELEDEPWEIAEDISRKPYRILLAIQNEGGEARTPAITEYTGYPNHIVNYYFDQLRNADLIKRVDDGTGGPGIPREGYLYRLQERGVETLSAAQEDYQLDPLEQGEVRRRFDDLDRRMSRVEQRLDQVVAETANYSEALDENSETIQGLGRAGKAAANRIRKLEEEIAELQTQIR
ncbi:hypothetical protein [Natronorarus salvus]|uniref:hypothetical protein n=1 Tax=Natronorarus salvus TaxID=3117733 RepID=UPI002F26D790